MKAVAPTAEAVRYDASAFSTQYRKDAIQISGNVNANYLLTFGLVCAYSSLVTSELELMHGNDWAGQDVAGWWASEKFDGWRVRWTGTELLTRHGNKLNPPHWFLTGLPSFALDCELWAGRGNTHTDVAKLVAKDKWATLRLVAFDVPGLSAEEAIAKIPAMMSAVLCKVYSTQEAKDLMWAVVNQCGEGIMLRKPGSAYVPCRTDDLLKMKP